MRELIGTYGPMLGETEAGRDWCLKALHPADQLVSIEGVPDECSASTTIVNWQQVNKIGAQTGATGTWTADIMMLPAPDAFASIRTVDSVGTAGALIYNQALGASQPAALAGMLAGFERWRLAYASVSIYFDGPALSDQGTVVAAQYPVEMQEFSPGLQTQSDQVGGTAPSSWGRCLCYHAVRYQAGDFPSFLKLQVMPNAYFGEAKDGVYMPLKLSAGHSDWHSQRDCVFGTDGLGYTGTGQTTTISVPLRSAAMTTADVGTPWVGSTDLFWDGGNTYPLLSYAFGGDLHAALCSDGVGGICFQNLSVNAGLSVYFRYGFECQCQPSSPYASWLKVSPMYDPKALIDYYRIVRELKDAYPVEYNDLGKLWDVIKAAAGAIADLTGWGRPLRAIGAAVAAATGGGRARGAKPSAPAPKVPAAALERTRKYLASKAATVPAVRVTRARGTVKFVKPKRAARARGDGSLSSRFSKLHVRE
jgi:hypothetical protein